jgi:hypothetical protein
MKANVHGRNQWLRRQLDQRQADYQGVIQYFRLRVRSWFGADVLGQGEICTKVAVKGWRRVRKGGRVLPQVAVVQVSGQVKG